MVSDLYILAQPQRISSQYLAGLVFVRDLFAIFVCELTWRLPLARGWGGWSPQTFTCDSLNLRESTCA